jgi:dinuclear metal center YbgI/SA1388 family protein
MTVTIADAVAIMNGLAPPALAESWDNVGLQIGQPDWPLKTAWVALDPSPGVVEAACRAQIDLLITHHPLFLKPIRSINFNTPLGKIIHQAGSHRLSIFSAHTNLDSARGGINDRLADLIGIQEAVPLQPLPPEELCKLVLFTPVDAEKAVLAALCEAGAGQIGQYSCCTFSQEGTGTFLPGAGTAPAVGKKGRLNRVTEVKIEAIVPRPALPGILEHVRKHHPYETMAYDVYPLLGEKRREGLGRLGTLKKSVRLADLAANIKATLGADACRTAGSGELEVSRVAVCSGSGGSLIEQFLSTDADVFVTGDIRYHDARTVEEAGRGIIDIGHFSSEHIVVNLLTEQLTRAFSKNDMPVSITPCTIEKDPFRGVP